MSGVVGSYKLGSRAIHEPLVHLRSGGAALQPIGHRAVIYSPVYTPEALRLSMKVIQDMTLDRLQTVSEVWREAADGPADGNAQRARRVEEVIRLLDKWTADESGYDEETWPELKAALQRNRLSSRPLFND
jgi:hypothetical protein